VFADIEATLTNLANDLGADTVVEIVDLYMTDAPQNVSGMRASLAAGDVDGLRRAAHTLKSTAATIGANELSELCRIVEALARERKPAEAVGYIDRIAQAESDSRAAVLGLRPKLAELIET